MDEEQSGLERLVGRVRRGLERGRSSLARKVVPISAARAARSRQTPRQRPYLEALEPRVLLSADVGLVPEAMLAPPADDFDPRLLVEPEIHDDVLVREPSKFEKIAREALVQTRVDQLEIVSDQGSEEILADETSAATSKESVELTATADGANTAGPEDPDAAARALRDRVWQAGLIDELAQAAPVEQVIVIDARVPEVDSLLEALLLGVGGSVDEVATGGGATSHSWLDAQESGESGSDSQNVTGLVQDDAFLGGTGSEKAERTRADSLAEALEARGVAVIVLDSGRDGLDQLAEIARAYQGVGAMHVVSHGARGSLTLGKSRVTTETLRARAGLLAGLRDSLGEDGDLLLYGCDVAGGEVGIEFVSTLAELGGIDVAASTDLTGASALGGDWNLEYATGEIEAAGLYAESFGSVLGSFTLPEGVTSLTGDLTISFDTTDATWRLSVSNGAALVDDSATPVTASTFDLESDEDVRITLGSEADVAVLRLDETDVRVGDPAFSGTVTLEGGAGEDDLSVSVDGALSAPGGEARFTGGVTLSGGADADTLTIADDFEEGGLTSVTLSGGTHDDTLRVGTGFDAISGVFSLRGGDDSDAYDLAAVDVAHLSALEIVEDVSGSGTDSILYSAPVGETDLPSFVDSAGDLVAQADVIEETDAVGPGTFTSAQVESILDGLAALRDDLGVLASSGEFALDLAGIRGNVGVTVGGAIDLAAAFDELILEIEANREGLTTDSLRSLLANLSRTAPHLDRTMFGEVIASAGLDHSALGFTLQLDDEDALHFGQAATSDVTLVGVEIQEAGAELPELTFRREQNGDATIRRSEGGWKADGFRAGQTITLDAALAFGSVEADARRFEIASISGDDRVITLKEAAPASDDEPKQFDAFLDTDADATNDLLTVRAGITLADGAHVAVANTLFIAAGTPSFAESGFRKDQAIRLSVTDRTDPIDPNNPTSETDLTINSLSEDGRVITVAGSLPDLGDLDTATVSAIPFGSNQTLSDLAAEINSVLDDSELKGRVQAVVTDVGTAAGPQTGRLGFRVLDLGVQELELVVTDEAPIGFAAGVEHLHSDLDEELSGLGTLDARVSGPSYVVSTFDLEQPVNATLARISGDGPETSVFSSSTLIFNVAANGQGTITRSDATNWEPAFLGDVVEITQTTFNNGFYEVVEVNGTVLTLERTLSATGVSVLRTITRTEGSWSDDGFVAGETVSIESGGATFSATLVTVGTEDLEISGSETDLGSLTGHFVAKLAHADPVALDYDATTNTFTYAFRYSGERTTSFNIDLGNLAAENGLKFAADVSVDLLAAFSSKLSLVVDLDENGSGVPDDAATPSAVTLDRLEVSANVNTPDVPTSDLPADGANSDLARSIFRRNIAQGRSSDIGFLGAEVSDGNASTTMDAFIALRGTLTGAGTDSSAYTSDSFLALDIPIRLKEGLVGLGSGLTPSISSLTPQTSPSQLVFDTGSVFEGAEAFGDAALFQGFEGDIEKFANIDAPGFVRLLGEIRTGLQRVNDSEQLAQFDVPFIKDGLSSLTNLANAFGNAILFDDGGDGLDRDNDKALVTDLNKKLVGTDLEGLVEFRVVKAEFGADSIEGRTFELVAIDKAIVSIDLEGGPFFGITAASGVVRNAETGALKLTGSAPFDPIQGRLETEQSATLTIRRSNDRMDSLAITLTPTDTADNEISGNDAPKLLDADNSPTFSTAQELSRKLIEIALDELAVDNLEFDSATSQLVFSMDLEQELFSEDFDVDFDLDLDPVGSIETVGKPKIRVSGEIGFSIEFGIDLSDQPNGAAGIEEGTLLTDLRAVDEITDLIKLEQAITIRGNGSVAEVNAPESPEEDRQSIELDRVRMAAGTRLDFGSLDFVAPVVENLIGDKLQIVAPAGYNVRIFQELTDGSTRLTDDSLQQQSLILPRATIPGDPVTYASEITDELTFFVAVYDANGVAARVLADGRPDPNDSNWVEVTVAAPTPGIDVTSRAGKNEYIGLVRTAIRNAQAAEVSNTITRLDGGDWLAEGFTLGQTIDLSNGGSNSGRYEITRLTATTLTVRQDLDAATNVSNVQIEGAGKITAVSDENAFVDFDPGTRIQIVGSARNDGTYLVVAKSGEGALILASALDPESASSGIQVVADGSPLRLEAPEIQDDASPEEVTAAEEAAAARFNVVLDGTSFAIVIFAAETESDPFAPHTADNRSPNDLLQDLRVALTRATVVGGDGETVDLTAADRSDRVVASLDGSRLVLTRVGNQSTTEFSIVGANENAQRLGFEPSQTSNRADLLVVLSNGEEALVVLDGLTTVGEVLSAIENAFPASTDSALEGSRVTARVSQAGTGIEIVERGQLTGRPSLVVREANGSDLVEFTRSKGSWSEDGFRSTGGPQTFQFEGQVYTVTTVDDATRKLTARSAEVASADAKRIVSNATITIEGVTLGSGNLNVELINGSVAAGGLGILRADAASDVNEDGVIDDADADGLLEGDAIGGASLFDRIFIRDPEFTVGLQIAPVDNQIDVNARIGFVEADLALRGGFGANGVFGLNDLPPVNDSTAAPDGKITLREFARGIKSPRTFIDTPKFEAGSLDEDFTGSLVLTNELIDGESRGIVERSVGSWNDDDGFMAGQRVVVRNSTGVLQDGTYTILEVRNVDRSGTSFSQLVLEETLDLGGNPTATLTGATIPEMIGTFGVFTLELTSIGAEGLGSIDLDDIVDDPDNARVQLTLFDFGDPFFRESMGLATAPTADDPDGRGGSVVATGLDTLSVTREALNPQKDDIDKALRDVRGALDEKDEVRVEIVYLDKDGNEQKETRKVKEITAPAPPAPGQPATPLTLPVTLTLVEDFVDDLTDIRADNGARVIQKITFTKPPKTEIQTPDFGSLLDFDDISIRDIIRGLQLAADFLGQFEEFAFLDSPIPVIELSFNDLLDYADQLAVAVEEIENDPDGTLQTIETRLEELLGITEEDPFDIQLSIVSEVLEARGVAGTPGFVAAGTHKVLKLGLTLGDDFQESIGIEFDIAGGGVLAGSAGLEANGSAAIQIDLGLDVSLTEVRGHATLELAAAGVRSITRDDGANWANDGFRVGQTIKLKNAGERDGRYTILAITNDAIELEGGDDAAWAAGAPTGLPPIEVTGSRGVSVFNSTGISAIFNASATDVDFRAAAGPVGLFIQGGTVAIHGAIDSPSGPAKIFDAGLAGEDADRRLFGALLDSGGLAEAFEVRVESEIQVSLPVFFPTDNLFQGTLGYAAELALLGNANGTTFEIRDDIADGLGLSIARANGTLVEGNTAGEKFSNFFTFDGIDPRELSLFDNVRLAVDGFDLILGGIQDVLDGEILGIDLPLIGDSLADGARFIEELRDDFVEPFRDGLDDAESFVDDVADPNKNIISRLLFDELSKTGLLLVTHAQNGTALSEDQVFTARASQLVGEIDEALRTDNYDGIAVEERVFMLSQVIRLNGTRKDETPTGNEAAYFDSRATGESRGIADGAIDLAGIPSGEIKEKAFLEWDFRLGSKLSAVDADIALDFGLPAIGLEADGALGIELAWDLELGFGLDFESGFYFDIGSSSELEIDVDVVLPDSLTGRLGFLQLEAENAGSGLGASFAVDLVNKSDATDDRLSFTELGKLRLEAGVAAEARALLDLELKINEELLADFPNVFPTVIADFEFEWAIGDRGISDLTFDGDTITSRATVLDRDGNPQPFSFMAEGYAAGQVIRISGLADSTFDGAYRITGVSGNRLTVVFSADGVGSPDFELTASEDSFRIFRDVRNIDGSALSAGLQNVRFSDVALDLGSFISDFAKPILSEIQKVTGPIQPIVDILTKPLPVISDLGPPVTLLDLARMTGTFNTGLIEAIADIITLVNAIPTNVDNVVIGFGDFVIFELMADGSTMGTNPADKNADLGNLSKEQGATAVMTQPSQQNQTTGFVNKLKNTRGFKFPILSDPTSIFGLLTGEEVVLFGYDMPVFELDLSYTAFFPLFGPLGIGVTGTAGAKIDFAFGFDSSGLQRFLDSGFSNPEVIFDGFFVSDNPEDVTGAGPDLPELVFDLGIFLSAELNLGIARAGVAGGVEAGVQFNLFDPNDDGKIRVGEILENIENEFLFGQPLISPLAIFDITGQVTARAFAFLEINLLFFEIYEEFPITPTLTLADFEVEFTRAPKLGTVLEDGMLQLNMGDFSGERLHGDLRDLSEHFVVKSVGDEIEVTWVGSNPGGRDFFNAFDASDITGIVAVGGVGNDTIDVSLVTKAGMRYELDGGAGNDTILAGNLGSANVGGRLGAILRGGDGSDRIVGTAGDDLIVGGAGSDLIIGGGGNDVIFADLDRLVEKQPRVRNIEIAISGRSAGYTSVTLSDLDPEADFVGGGFAVNQTVTLKQFDGNVPTAERVELFESVYIVTAVGPTSLTLRSVVTGEADFALPSITEGSVFEIAAQDAEFLSAYQARAGDSDGDDVVFGGFGNDFIFGAGGADVLLGGSDSDDANTRNFSARFDTMKSYRRGTTTTPAAVPILPSNDPSGNDVILGDGGEIRLDRDGLIRRDADGVDLIVNTDRGLAFGDDLILGSGGADRLYGGLGDDEIRGGDGADEIHGERGFDRLFADAGADEIFGGRDDDQIEGGAGADRLFGEQGADTIFGDGGPGVAEAATDGGDFIRGDSGSDLLFGGGGIDDIAGGSDLDEIHGGGDRDILRGDAGDDLVFGDDGNDEITVRDGSDVVDGGRGNDTIIVNFKGAENSARVKVTGGLDIDDLVINGTARADQFLLRAAADRVNGLTFVASINEGSDVERVDYEDFESLIVNGRAGDDRFALDDLTAVATLNGGGGDDYFQVGQLYRNRRTIAGGNIAPEDQFATVEVSRGFLSNGISNDATINGGNDNDTVVVYRNLATLTVNGQAGDDSIEVRAFVLVNPLDKLQQFTKISGGGGADTIRYAVNAPVNIDGGDGLDSVTVIGTEQRDEFVITKDGVFGAGLNVNFVNVELLKVDGAEGDDSFFIQSTNENILTQVVGGLGSDTFHVADGVERSVVSNDLLGHSGLIFHDVESDDPFYQGPENTGITADGVSANVGDADEAGIVVSQSNGFTRVAEGGVLDWYTVVLTRRPNQDVRVIVNAPELSPEATAQGEDLLRVWRAGADGEAVIVVPTASNPNPGQNLVLTFTSENWHIPQVVFVEAADDLAGEEERFGVIQHKIEGQSFESDRAVDPSPEITAITGPRIIDDEVERDLDGDIVTVVDLAGELDLGADTLRGRLFQVTSAPSLDGQGGVGQSLLVKSSETIGTGANAFTRITLFGVFDPEDPAQPGSGYLIRLYDGLVARTVTVQIDDNDAADVILTPLVDGVAVEDLDAFETTDTQSGPTTGHSFYQIELGRAPRDGVSTVRVQLDVTTANFEDEQVEIAIFDPSDPTASVVFSDSLILSFADGVTPQFIQVRAVGGAADGVPEGFHRGLIQHSVLTEVGSGASRDVDEYVLVDEERVDLEPGQLEAESILLEHVPVQFRGNVNAANDGVTSTTITGFDDVEFTVSDLADLLTAQGVSLDDLTLRITKGTGSGQIRSIESIDGNTIAIPSDDPWETDPDETSRFSVSGVQVSLFDATGSLIEELDESRFDLSGNEIIFLDPELSVESRTFSFARVSYAFLDPGYEGRVEERLPIRIADGDSAGVLILESGGSTDVIEVNEFGTGAPGVPDTRPEGADDSYQIVLSRPPSDGNPVRITVSPEATRTERGDLVNDPAIQVEIRAAAGSGPFSQSPIVLVFDSANWNIPQTVEVRAVTDGRVDGGDIKAFAPYLRTLTEIQGPLLVDGAGGQGSLEGLAPPVLLPAPADAGVRVGEASQATANTLLTTLDEIRTTLGDPEANVNDLLGRSLAERNGENAGQTRTVIDVEVLSGDRVLVTVDENWSTTELSTIDGFELEIGGETNSKTPTGSVLRVEVDRTGHAARTFVTVRAAELDAVLEGADSAGLVDLTLEIVRGEGTDQFRQILGVTPTATGTEYVIEVAPLFDVADDRLVDVIAYKITKQSLNFFVDEAVQQDLIFIHDEDSPANSRGEMIALDFADYPAMQSIFNGSLDPSDPDFLVPNRLVGFGMGADTTIARGLRPGGITYANFEGFELDLGFGNNELFIDTVHERDDEVETFTRIRTGRGDDTIDVSLQNGPNADGRTPWVEIDAGLDDDTIDASAGNASNGIATTIGLDLVGGLGNDTIFGGEANDLIHGDFGSLDFEIVDRSPVELLFVESTRIEEGGTDTIDGGGGADRLFGGASDDRIRGGTGNDIVFGDYGLVVVNGPSAYVAETTNADFGGEDVLEGGSQDDLLFGGSGFDTLRGEDGQDTLFGDYGKVTQVSSAERIVETTELFRGAADSIDGGRGNDLIFGGAGGDVLIGTLRDDLLIGEYARVRFRNSVATSVVRLGQGSLDVAASTFFGLYDPRFGPFAEFILPTQSALSGALAERPPVSLRNAESDLLAGPGGLPTAVPYEVKTGDTLWDIAERELGDPYRWTEIHALSQDTITNPDLIEPNERVRIPGRPTPTSEAIAEERLAVERLRERLAADAAERQALADAGWGFFNPVAVGAGPPGEGDSQLEQTPESVAPAPSDADGLLSPEQGGDRSSDGALREVAPTAVGFDGESDPALSGLIWSSLVGWRATSNPAATRSRGKWLRFDEREGRFA